MKTRTIASALLFALSFAPAAALARNPGVWSRSGDTKGDDWVQIAIACRQQYLCSPGQDILHERPLHTTPAEWVTGACSAGSGAVDSCNLCLTNPPETPCEWWLEGDD